MGQPMKDEQITSSHYKLLSNLVILKHLKCWGKLCEAFKNKKSISATSCSCSYVKFMVNGGDLSILFFFV